MMPLRLLDQSVYVLQLCVVHAQPCEIEPPDLLFQQASTHALPLPGGDRGYAHINRFACHAQRNTAILGQTLLGDVLAFAMI